MWPRSTPPAPFPALAAGLLTLALGSGCDFFKELKSADSAEAGETDSDGDTNPEALQGQCAFPQDDRCLNQDILQRCDPQSLEAEPIDCGVECGSFLNFSCVNTGAGHGCWCVEPGAQKVYSCTELESCLERCVADATGTCADQCFGRTTQSTIRMYGALVNCAHDQCHEMCTENPQYCGACVDSGLREGAGACGLQRSVCDEDRNDEEPFFP